MSDQPPQFPGGPQPWPAGPSPGAPSPGPDPTPGGWAPPPGPVPGPPPPGYPAAGSYPPPGSYLGWPTGAGGALPQPPKRSKAGLIVGLVAAIVVLGLIAAAALIFVGRKDHSYRTLPPVSVIPPSQLPSIPTSGPGSTNATPVAPPPVVAGYKLVENQEKGFAFLVPTTWTPTELTVAQIDQLIARVKDTNPQLVSTLEQLKAGLGTGGLAFAFGPTTDAFTPSVNLIRLPITGITPAQIAGQLGLSLGAVNGKILSRTPVTIGGNQGIQLGVQITVNQPGGAPRTMSETVLVLASPTATYVFTIAGADPATTKVVLGSLRVR